MSDSSQIEGVVLDLMPAAVVVADVTGRVVYRNRAAAELFGDDAGAALPGEVELAVRRQGQWAGDATVAGRRLHCRVAPVRDAGGRVVGSIAVSFEQVRRGADAQLTSIGSRIMTARVAQGMTQQQLADELGVTRRSVQGYESGHVAPYRHLDRLAEILEHPRAWFIAGDGQGGDAVLREVRRIVREEVAALR